MLTNMQFPVLVQRTKSMQTIPDDILARYLVMLKSRVRWIFNLCFPSSPSDFIGNGFKHQIPH